MTVDGESASLEIEALLRATDDKKERALAIGRATIFALSVVMSTVIHVLFFMGNRWGPPLYFLVLTVYASVFWFIVRKHGATTPIVYGSIVLDLLIIGTLPDVFTLLGNSDAANDNLSMRLTVNAPALFLILAIHSLRHRRGPLALGVVLAPVVLAVTTWRPGAPPHLVIVASILLAFAGASLVVGSEDTRKLLHLFARMQLLRRFVPKAAVARVLSRDPDRATALGGDLVDVTVIATDLRGFTAMSEKLAPAEVVRHLNAYHAAMLACVERHGGALDKFIGDGALIVFGLDGGDAKASARAAVASARDMLAALDVLNRERASGGLPPLKMGIGVHSGPVVAGNIGAGRRLEFTIIGDTVNTAARLEGLTKDAGTPLLVSEATAALVGGEGLLARAPMEIRGRTEPLVVFEAGARSEA